MSEGSSTAQAHQACSDQVTERQPGVRRDTQFFRESLPVVVNRKAIDADCTVRKSHSQISTACGFSWLEKPSLPVSSTTKEKGAPRLGRWPAVRSLIRIRPPSTGEYGVHQDEKVTIVKCLPNLPSKQKPK